MSIASGQAAVNAKLEKGFKEFPKPDIHVAYGTAGFRFKADLLPSTMYRMGYLASVRSRHLKGQAIGVMITASHNPPADNGVKLVDPQGEMLEASWEIYATQLANAATPVEFVEILDSIASTFDIDLTIPAHVIYGYDSRSSSVPLCNTFVQGLKDAGVDKTQNCGLVTTPQLHYVVKCVNTQNSPEPYGEPSENGYYAKLSDAYKKIISGLQVDSSGYSITIDAANGVGAPKVAELAKHLSSLLDVTVVNGEYKNAQLLNSQCGADFVKTNQNLPGGIDSPQTGKLYCSFDGDADRIIFFYLDAKSKFQLLDGDKIATLAAGFLGELVSSSETGLKIGVVQTAYANGSSTEYLTKSLRLPVDCTATGVKHLHHAALAFDIGIYFEANGHGTVLFQPAAIQTLRTAKVETPAQKAAIDTLLAFSDLINQTVGDAISDLLMVLATLSLKHWGPDDWDSSYTDLPNRLLKAEVKNRTLFKTTDAERKLVSPPGLQDKIDATVEKYLQGRSFVRASGTENVVRIYAEAATRAQADELALLVSKLLEDYN